MARRITIVVAAHESGMRLDRLLVAHVPELGRKRARDLFAQGKVLVDGRAATPGHPARAGAELVCELAEERAEPDTATPLHVRLEQPGFVVLEKPAGQPSVPVSPGEKGTVANALVARYPEMADIGYRAREPGLIHRLDTQTSGLLVAARDPSAFVVLRAALQAGQLGKHYLAITEDRGLPERGMVDHPIGPDPRRAERVIVYDSPPPAGRYARKARTTYRVIERKNQLLLLELEAPHAMRHQVRAHLAFLGHPILGDVVYGAGLDARLGQRHALHASYIAWAGDATVPSFAVRSDLPEDLACLFG